MTKTKSTKRALLMSALSLLMCVSMLIGSTFAWFTDSVTSAGNTIQSGTLKVDLVDAQDNSLEGKVLKFDDQDDNDLWEPGCTYKLQEVYVKNMGTLALKYEIAINGITGDAKLLEAIEWTVTVNGVETKLADLNGKLGAGEKSKAIVLTGHMKEEAGNEYQGLTVDGISISVFATQDTVEKDSFDENYDDIALVSDADELKAAIAEGKNVMLTNDVAVDANTTITVANDANIILDLNGHEISGTSSASGKNRAIFTVKGEMSVIGNGTVSMVYTGSNMEWNNLSAPFSVEAGVLTLGKGVSVMNFGGTDMAYAVDVNTTLGETVLNVDGATLYSTYIGVRIFNNHSTAKGIVNYNDGIIYGAKNGYDIWAQLMSKPAENAVVNIADGISYTTADKSGTMYYIEDDATLVSNYAGLVDAINNGGEIVLASDINVSEPLTMNKSFTLDLNGKTLYMSTTDDSKISSAANVIIKNGNVDISGVNFTEHNGIFNITGGAANTLTVENVNFYGDGFTSYSVFWIAKASSGINTLNLIDSKFELKNEAYASGGFIKHPSSGENCSAINITNSVLDFENVTRLFLYGAYNIKDSEISFVDTTGEANGLRQGQFTIDNSKITISGGDKGISPRYADTVIKNGSVVTINNTKGNDVIFEYDFDVVVDSSSTFTYGTTSGTAGGQVIDN